MSAITFEKDCQCERAGAETGRIIFSWRTEPITGVEIRVCVYHPGPSCIKCDKPWRLVTTPKPLRYCVHGLAENRLCLTCPPWRRLWDF
jgi:hypothetical protein